MRGNRETSDPSRRTPDDIDSPVAPDVLFDVLSDALRRRVLHRLDAADGRVDLRALAERVADDGTTAEDVAVRLHHVHLPKLDEAGLVVYDAEARTVVLTP